MTIQIRIDRLVAQGLPLSSHDGETLRTAVAEELGRLLEAGPLDLRSGAATARVSAPQIAVDASASPGDLAREIARSIYGGIQG